MLTQKSSSMLLIQKSNATDFTIGGSKGWTVDSSATSYYNQWAEKNRFQIGDTIVFVYPAGQDSVLLVNQKDYNNCYTENPQRKFSDGHTTYKFTQSGPHYFISGNKENCQKNEKVVVVLADRSNRYGNSNQTIADSPPPSAEASPSPAPSGEMSPPAATGENNPTPAPTSDQTPPPPPPPSGASATFISFMGCMGAFVASSLFLVF
ncbi:hypothetical protein UlMin_003505 [Ulmus minor]